MNSSDQFGFIPPHGHYRELLSYQKAEVVSVLRTLSQTG